MKHQRLFRFAPLLLLIVALLSLTACRNESDDSPATDGGKGKENGDSANKDQDPSAKGDQRKDPGPTGDDNPPLRAEPLFAASEVVCTPPSDGTTPEFCMHGKWETSINVGSESQILLTVVTKDRFIPTQTVDVLDVLPWMPEHHHGQGDELTVIHRVAGAVANQYLVGNIQFIMPGHWELRTKVTFDGKEATLAFPVEVP